MLFSLARFQITCNRWLTLINENIIEVNSFLLLLVVRRRYCTRNDDIIIIIIIIILLSRRTLDALLNYDEHYSTE